MSLPSLLTHHWRLAPGLNIAATLYAALYLLGVRRVGGHWPVRRTGAFLAGILVVLVALQSGYDAWDDRLLSAHMVQHMLLLLVAPALLVAGHPAILLLRALPPRRRPPVARCFGRLRPLWRPLPCLLCFSAVVVLTHLPGFYDATFRDPLLHGLEHLLYLLAGTAMWWPILGGEPLPSARLGGLGMLVYLLFTMPSMALVGASLNRAPHVVYPPYGAPGAGAQVSALHDQAQAGAIMWVGGDMIVVVAGLWAILAAMVAEERRLASREARLGAAGGGA